MLLPAALALFAGACFGLTAHIQRAALVGADIRIGTFVSLASMAALSWVLAPFLVDPAWWSSRAVWIFALCGLMFPALSQTLQILGVAKVGPTLTSAMGSVAPFFAALPAVLFLGEAMSVQIALGMSVVVLGLMLSALSAGAPSSRDWSLLALLIPVGASAARGLTQPITKFGMLEVPSPFFATLVMVSVSSAVVSLRLIGRRAPEARATPRGIALFAVNGIINGLGILALLLAINLSAVTIAAPLATTAPLWTLVFGALFFRTEVIRPRQWAFSLLVVLGVVLIVAR
ncbi:hypothetical protein AIOL_003454 [Candidatus Rhodobacter oscarellae]|uniref:EamA domain-containing protein n=1 Tax=Candidatus Rhodobacter oscarellae TaxID=1675527 RepID=A0A0J9E9Y5_9RHOB|nr:DMT family transporter [Candidatus Rhodobacter lobularis]KMW58479.1 hypothetical protein AIOL_003454 [Candidatus Rhodobacter lobularis]